MKRFKLRNIVALSTFPAVAITLTAWQLSFTDMHWALIFLCSVVAGGLVHSLCLFYLLGQESK